MNANKVDLKGAVSAVGRPYRCEGERDSSPSDAAEMGIYIDEWQVDPQRGFAQSAGGVDGVCDCP